MKKALKKLVLHYLREVSCNGVSEDDLVCMADNFVNDYTRLKSAREDFKEAM